MMLGGAAAILLCLLPSPVNGLITTDAKCLSGYEWLFSSIGQSPCDVAAELASVCVGGQFNLLPLDAGYIYGGPTLATQNNCRCSSVYYSLLSGCSHCQARDYLEWSMYNRNCSKVYLTIYTENIPVGVKVPAYAYQDVSISDSFNVTLAQRMGGIESSRPPSASTPTVRPSLGPSSSDTAHSGITNSTPAIIGGVVGGVLGLGLIAALIIFLVLRSKQKAKSQDDTLGFRQSLDRANTTASFAHSTRSPPPGSPGMVYNATGQSAFADPNMYDPYRQHSPPLNQNLMANSAQSPQTIPEHTSGRYSGMPEF